VRGSEAGPPTLARSPAPPPSTVTARSINIATPGTIVAIAGGLSPTGKLDLKGTVSGRSLMIGAPIAPDPSLNPTLPATLQIDGTATAPSAIAINNAQQTLEIGPSGKLTIGAAENISNGMIQLDGT